MEIGGSLHERFSLVLSSHQVAFVQWGLEEQEIFINVKNFCGLRAARRIIALNNLSEVLARTYMYVRCEPNRIF